MGLFGFSGFFFIQHMVFKLCNFLNGNTNQAKSFFKTYAEKVQKLENKDKEILITTGYAVVGTSLMTFLNQLCFKIQPAIARPSSLFKDIIFSFFFN